MKDITIVDSGKAFFRNTYRYFPLLEHMIKRDVKKQYRGSFLGYVWSVLNPLLIMVVMYFVFSSMFPGGAIDNFPVYLFAGRMMFSLITDATTSGMVSISGNAGLIKKTPVPKYIFPIANITSSLVTFLFSLGAFAIVLLFTKTPIGWSAFFFPVVILQTYLFSLGLGFFLAQANVFFKDTMHLYGVFTTAWMYLTPLFYPFEQLSAGMQRLIANFNPAYFYVEQARAIFLRATMPSNGLILRGTICAVIMLVLGLITFKRKQDRFILHI